MGSADMGSSEFDIEIAIGDANELPSVLIALDTAGGASVAPPLNPKVGGWPNFDGAALANKPFM